MNGPATTSEYDIVIVGAGMVGAALAAALAPTGLKLLLLEANRPEPFSSDQPHDLRVSAISPASENFIRHIGAWQGVEQRRLCPYKRMRVWETSGQGDTRFDCADIDQPVLGHIVENRILQLALWEQIEHCDTIELRCPVRVERLLYQPDQGKTQLSCDDGSQLRCRLLVAADGGFSWVRQQVGIGVHNWSIRNRHWLLTSRRVTRNRISPGSGLSRQVRRPFYR
ncbi:FAD-dependent monooxygenase [Motiliproteus sp.]|uniref:FAD-dependent monooxygenase n=1 Tax=Motiliproteus sp. TaxID=1898955 RepID=UPI003BAA8940